MTFFTIERHEQLADFLMVLCVLLAGMLIGVCL